jgi:hypothetical protein
MPAIEQFLDKYKNLDAFTPKMRNFLVKEIEKERILREQDYFLRSEEAWLKYFHALSKGIISAYINPKWKSFEQDLDENLRRFSQKYLSERDISDKDIGNFYTIYETWGCEIFSNNNALEFLIKNFELNNKITRNSDITEKALFLDYVVAVIDDIQRQEKALLNGLLTQITDDEFVNLVVDFLSKKGDEVDENKREAVRSMLNIDEDFYKEKNKEWLKKIGKNILIGLSVFVTGLMASFILPNVAHTVMLFSASTVLANVISAASLKFDQLSHSSLPDQVAQEEKKRLSS